MTSTVTIVMHRSGMNRFASKERKKSLDETMSCKRKLIHMSLFPAFLVDLQTLRFLGIDCIDLRSCIGIVALIFIIVTLKFACNYSSINTKSSILRYWYQFSNQYILTLNAAPSIVAQDETIAGFWMLYVECIIIYYYYWWYKHFRCWTLYRSAFSGAVNEKFFSGAC